MLKEKRQILFDYANIFEALNIQRENHGDSLIPDSTILNIIKGGKNNNDIIISLKNNTNHEVYKTKISEDLFIKGLCLFCVKHKIIFPQSGNKKITLKDGKVVLSNILKPE